MDVYWAIAKSPKSGDVAQTKIEAATTKEAWEKARKWRKKDLGFWNLVAVAKEIPEE